MSTLDYDPDDSCDILRTSDLFDAAWYRCQAGEACEPDPVRHYVEQGWREGIEPNASFPGSTLQAYFASAGLCGPPAVTWLTLSRAGWAMPRTLAEAEHSAGVVRSSELFDAVAYARRSGIGSAGLDPAMHYVLVGERTGIVPSESFDPRYYAERNPDVGESGLVWLAHYLEHGRAEGRRCLAAGAVRTGVVPDPARANVLLVVHETSRTGAPILGWNIGGLLAATYNLYTLHLGDGALTPAFQALSVETIGPFIGGDRNPLDIGHALRRLMARAPVRFALVNSAEARLVIEPLAEELVATLFLTHEFAAYVSPAASLRTAFDWAQEIVFPAPVVARAAMDVHPMLRARTPRILPQGMSLVPGAEQARSAAPVGSIADLGRRRRDEGAFVVLGAGLVQIRKGVDFFLAVAAAVLRAKPVRPVHFLWVGQGYLPRDDMSYSVYLHEQLTRSGISQHVTFQGELDDLEAVYDIADTFLLSSRLDPLPNVCIDAAVRGIPIVCFRDASGIADILLEDPMTSVGVVDHLDAHAAAGALLDFMRDEAGRRAAAEATRQLAAARFDMSAYVATLARLGEDAAGRMAQRARDTETLVADPSFDQEMFLGPYGPVETRRASVVRYLTMAAARGGTEPAIDEPAMRRPGPGFHPQVYTAMHPGIVSGAVDPFADFVRRGRPAGPWQADVLRLDKAPSGVPGIPLRVAIHAHFFYTDLIADFLRRLDRNRMSPDLLISTDTAGKADALQRILARRHGERRFSVRIVPNRGRNLGPLLTEFAEDLGDYDLVGHVHAKRSRLSGSDAMGNGWRDFLWQHLLGGRYPSVDRILDRFAQDAQLGLVFPGDPHVLGWAGNRRLGERLAERMGIAAPLPDAFDFPVGAMFWARPAALQPLLQLGLTWADYPDEPLGYDGTVLHALERLPVLAAARVGYRYAVTHVPGISWAP